MTAPRKYLFEAAFTADGALIEAPAQRKPSFFQEDLDAARAEGFAAGERAAAQDLAAQAASAQNDAIRALSRALMQSMARLDTTFSTMHDDASALAMAVARALAGEALAAFGHERALELARSALEDLAQSPTARLIVSPQHADSVGPLVNALLQTQHLETRVAIIADPAMSAGDVRIEFNGGALALKHAEIADRIAAILATVSSPEDKTP